VIRGSVQNLEARVWIRVVGPAAKEIEVDAVIDTGYTGTLSLPPTAVQSLDLQWMSTARGILADGAEAVFDRYRAQLDWNGSRMDVLVDEADTTR
jgi:clan AA aspartic protease